MYIITLLRSGYNTDMAKVTICLMYMVSLLGKIIIDIRFFNTLRYEISL